jgi:hypothetical protein
MNWKYGGEYEDEGTLFRLFPKGYAEQRFTEDGTAPM